LNVPDRYIGHRVCPHIWVPRPAWTGRPALGQVQRVKSPAAQIACLSPYLVPGRLPNVTLRRPRFGGRTVRCQRSRYWHTEQTRSL